jgi:hypothetical protein
VGRNKIRRNRNRNRRRNGNRSSNHKGNLNRMAIVHVSFKSSSTAPPAAAHAQYIAREGQYLQRGGVELVESGNMPEFAQADPHSFWVAADAHERANGRTYTELQIALPRELDPAQRQELAREATRELLGDRFAYTLAVHTPLAKDNIAQPHMHLMFSERTVTQATREIPEERFFKRNGAKKDPEWNDRNKPEEVREKWVEMMNAAMERHGHIHHPEQRLDARSWADQGRPDLSELREEKTLRGDGPEAMARHAEIDRLRHERSELPPPHLDRASAIQHLEQQAEQRIAVVQERTAQELSRLDKLIAAARELAIEVKERTVAAAQNVADRVEQLRGRFERWREQQTEGKPEQQLETQKGSLAQENQAKEKLQRAGPEQDMPRAIAQKLHAFRERYEANKQAREPAIVPEPPAKEPAAKREPEEELKIERGHDLSIGF